MQMPSNLTLRLAFLGASVFYLCLLPFIWDAPPVTNGWVSFAKAVPVSLLAVMVALNIGGKTRLLLLPALIFSIGGDLALSFYWDGNPPPFVVGLGLFLVAHLFYIALFLQDIGFRRHSLPALILIVASALIIQPLLLPNIPAELKTPVLIYMLVISTMAVLAAIQRSRGILLLSGALLFMASDSMIAFNAFVFDEPKLWAQLFIMLTYYSAQYCLAQSFLGNQQR